jgi:hypothetical protein
VAERGLLGIIKAGQYPVDFVSAENILMGYVECSTPHK